LAGKEFQCHGTERQPELVWRDSAAKPYQPPCCLPSLSTTSPHVDELALVEERIGGRGPHDVVTRLRLGLGGELGRKLERGDRVDAHLDAGLLAEGRGLPPQLLVRGGNEAAEGEHRQLAFLGERRGHAVREPRRRGSA
jgi:hypothetical protein